MARVMIVRRIAAPSHLRRIVAMVGVILGLALSLPPPAAAHTQLIASDPSAGASLRRPPAEVTLTFSEPMSRRLAVVALTIADGAPARLAVRAGADPTQLVASTPAEATGGGRWRVSFRVTSADGHPVQGDLSFDVARGGPEVSEETPAAPAEDAPAATTTPRSDTSDPQLVALFAIGGAGVLLALVLMTRRYLRVDDR